MSALGYINLGRKVNRLSGWRLLALWPLSMLLRLWNRTLRFSAPPELLTYIQSSDREPAIFVFWHNRLFVVAEGYRRLGWKKKIFGLVSASKDGSWLGALFQLLGIGAIRGSSSWRGSRAIKELINVLEAGHDVAITPDGPRGPCYAFKEGPALLAEKTGAPIWLCACNFEKAWRLKSWDRFYIPKPFSKITIEAVKIENSFPEKPLDHQMLREALLKMTKDI